MIEITAASKNNLQNNTKLSVKSPQRVADRDKLRQHLMTTLRKDSNRSNIYKGAIN